MPETRNREDFIDRWQTYNDLDFSEPICNKCDHKIEGGISCKAYPGGIPEEILSNDVDHRKEYIGDNGIVFKKRS